MTSHTPPAIDDEVRAIAKVLWDYHHISTPVVSADFILALGSHDERVAHHAARLMLDGLAPLLVTSGGHGKVTSGMWSPTEGDRFAQIARDAGVPESAIVVENRAANTGENLSLTRELLANRRINVRRGILVTKPYMARRSYATAARQWPAIQWAVSSPDISFEAYPTQEVPERRMIELMVGDLQRIAEYPRLGFQIPQDIPKEVWTAGLELAERGFDAFALKPST